MNLIFQGDMRCVLCDNIHLGNEGSAFDTMNHYATTWCIRRTRCVCLITPLQPLRETGSPDEWPLQCLYLS